MALMRGQSGGEDFERLGQAPIRIEDVPRRLSLAQHHVDVDAGMIVMAAPSI